MEKECYHACKMRLEEHYRGIRKLSDIRLKSDKFIITSIDNMIDSLPEIQCMVLKNEFVYDRKGKWYQGLISDSTYYRESQKAYSAFYMFINR